MLRSRRARRLSLAAALSGALMLVGAGLTLAADQSVTIAEFAFSPATVTVNVGDSVTWTNNDQAPHTATADDDSWDTGSIDAGGSGSVTFNTAGEFTYHCDFHNNMTGTVIVQGGTGGGGGATPEPTNPATDSFTSGGPAGPSTSMLLLGVFALLGAVVMAAAFLLDRRLDRG